MTEKELLKDQPKQLYRISQLINDEMLSLDDLSEIIPGIMHVNSKKDLSIQYVSQIGCDMLGYSLEEIKTLGSKLFEKHVSEYTRKNLFSKVLRELGKDDPNYVIPFFQDWQYKKDENPLYHFTSTKILNANQTISISLFPQTIELLSNTMNSLFGINKIMDKYFQPYNSLTKREKEILKHLGLELTRKEIGNLLFIDEKTVKKHCENIYRKLGTSKRIELEKIANALSIF
ncbi:LuxR family two component transcriptional regulator [Aquimarina sp. MAR_2010_214]|uniref:response regulator transcription factor n=1 Tax=Aquimarina sp. MAR_2010_214 TaxID=1250026 RepID=UPI000C7074B3|nr:LuxR C-terminal-related transcriptional regulator [Aquimarina sp. MAR_2010_214]PKV50853.1 LuxR family two component transcriptional regulator [Aquimarina sp. MAR_2010_214]